MAASQCYRSSLGLLASLSSAAIDTSSECHMCGLPGDKGAIYLLTYCGDARTLMPITLLALLLIRLLLISLLICTIV